MINVPKILKTERDLTGLFTIEFENLDPDIPEKEKKFSKPFSELRAGIAWPIRNVPGFLCIIGHYPGCRFGVENSLMLIYEKEFPTAPQLIQDAYNRAHDLRFTKFFTDCSRIEWRGFVHEFQRQINQGLGGRDIRLLQCPFPQDFILGKDVLGRLISSKALVLPSASLVRQQGGSITKAELDTDHPEYKWPALTAFRYVCVAWETESWNQRNARPPAPDVGPLGWA